MYEILLTDIVGAWVDLLRMYDMYILCTPYIHMQNVLDSNYVRAASYICLVL